MGEKFALCIIMPCFNEGTHFRMEEYSAFLSSHSDVFLCMVNDGSNDNTLDVLHSLQSMFPKQIHVLDLETNAGKAAATRSGIMYCLDNFQTDNLAYLDADLAISFDECYNMINYLKEEIVFCCGSRILKLGSNIKRKRLRFIAGRTIATFISEILDIKVYDTQCGCKVFKKEIAKDMFAEKFISTWLFDVEVFFRILIKYGKRDAIKKMLEVPLVECLDPGDSKIKITYIFKLFIELFKIRKKYKPLTKDIL